MGPSPWMCGRAIRARMRGCASPSSIPASASPPSITPDLNLLNNAVKFTEHGTVALDVRPSNTGADARLRFTIVDTGVGIAPEHHARSEPAEQRGEIHGAWDRRPGCAAEQYGRGCEAALHHRRYRRRHRPRASRQI